MISLYNKEKLIDRLNLIKYEENVYRPEKIISIRNGENYKTVFESQFLYLDNQRMFILNSIFDSPGPYNFICWFRDIRDVFNYTVSVGDDE